MFVSLLLCFLLYTLNYSHHIYFFQCFFFLVFFFGSHDAVCLLLCFFKDSLFEYLVLFFLVEVMLSCGIVIPSIQVRPTIHLLRRLLSFPIHSPSLFSSLLSVLAWAFFNKTHFTVFNTELIKRCHRVRIAFLGICIV